MWSLSSRDFKVLDRKVYTPEYTERKCERFKEDKVMETEISLGCHDGPGNFL